PIILFLSAIGLVQSGCNPNPFCLDCKEDMPPPAGDLPPIVVYDFSQPPFDLTPPPPPPDMTVCAVEICDHLDNDCNGVTDDVDPARLVSDPNNCGGCFIVCDYSMIHEFGACLAGPPPRSPDDGGAPVAHCGPSKAEF